MTVLLPVLNEVEHIDPCLESIAAQDYAGRLEIVVADGGSTDGTVDKLRSWESRDPRVRVIDNPRRLQSHGLNAAAAAASSPLLVRADAHTTYASDYISRSIAGLRGRAHTAVGGPMRPRAQSRFGRAVSYALTSPLAVGPAKFHTAGHEGPVDTVYLGTFTRADFDAIGGYRAFPSGVAEDADLYFRWRKAGGIILLDPTIRSFYRPREKPAGLFRQHFRYGRGKADMMYANRVLPSPRPLAPFALVGGLAGSAALGVATVAWWPALALLGIWIAVLTVSAAGAGRLWPGSMAAAAIMHVGYGAGMWWGALRGPRVVLRNLPAGAAPRWNTDAEDIAHGAPTAK